MAIFKEAITSRRYVKLKIVLQVPEHAMGQQKAICLLSATWEMFVSDFIPSKDHRYHDWIS